MLEGLAEDSLFRQRLTGHFPHLTGTYARRTTRESGWEKTPTSTIVQLGSTLPAFFKGCALPPESTAVLKPSRCAALRVALSRESL